MDIPRMFAALALITLAGLALFAATAILEQLILRRWHEHG
jgi:NitT/TauT family transport system permease protein